MSEGKWRPNKPNAALGLPLIPESLNVKEPFSPMCHYKDVTVSCHPLTTQEAHWRSEQTVSFHGLKHFASLSYFML